MDNNAVERAAVRATVPPKGVAVEFHEVVKSYGGRAVLRSLDLSIEPGQFVAIVGRSGCGKSTLLRLLAGLEQAQHGRILLDDREELLRRDVRIMFQDSRLLPWRRVIDNVTLGLGRESVALAREVLAEVGLAEREHDWPAQLSGGQRQRVALARALVHRPRLLLLDEPLGALDALTRMEMHTLIERLWLEHKFTALLVTHDVGEAVALADRIVLLDQGRVSVDEAVPLRRPRERGSSAFAAIEQRILQQVLGVAALSSSEDASGDRSLWRTVDQLRWAV